MYMKRVIPVLVFLLLGGFLSAHPHMFLTSTIELEFEGKECTGFWLEWVFDPYFSASIIQECDKNKDGKFDKAESDGVYQYGFINLKNYGYFTYIRIGDKRVNPDGVEQFTASIREDRLVYRFYIRTKGKGYGNDFSVAIFDTTYFCAIFYPETKPVIVRQAGTGALPKWEQKENKNYPIYYNPMGAVNDTTIYTAWRPGLETAYPVEVKFFF